MHPIHINFYLYFQTKKYFTLFKMAEKFFSGYESLGPTLQSLHNQTRRDKNSSNVFSLKMASVVMLIGGALANTLAFAGGSYLFQRLSKDSIDIERKRHNAAIGKLQAAQIERGHKCEQRIDFINNQFRLERKAETKFTELNNAMREYHEVFGHELPPLPRELVLSDYYTPSDEQHYRKLGFKVLSMIGIGGVLYYFEN